MSARIQCFSKLSLVLFAAIALSGCAHRHGEMPHHPMHHSEAQDARLSELVDAMNAAEGSAKVDAMAAVLNELAGRCGHAHGCMHKAHGPQGCGCPTCPHASQAPGCKACPHASGPCPMSSNP